MITSLGFKTGQKFFRERAAKLKSKEDCENPFEPMTQDYEDFWDGWCVAREAYSMEEIQSIGKCKCKCK